MNNFSEKFEKMRIAGRLAARTLDMLTDSKETISTENIKDNIDKSKDTIEIMNDEKFKKDVSDEIKNIEKTLEKDNILSEIDIKLPEKENSMVLKPANEVYLEIYKEARKRAKEAKKEAIKTYLEAKRIKSTYLLDDFERDYCFIDATYVIPHQLDK